MASLLSESEAENARLIELAQVLKEEIRSYRRSEERSKHIDNLEYVKNVILKVSKSNPINMLGCPAQGFLPSSPWVKLSFALQNVKSCKLRQ